jgi:hypothetical protein
MPVATPVLIKGRRRLARDPARPELEDKLKLQFGVGSTTTSGRSCIRWAPGRAQPAPPVVKERDLLRDGFDEDLLHKGL